MTELRSRKASINKTKQFETFKENEHLIKKFDRISRMGKTYES